MINYEKFNDKLKAKFNNLPRLVTEDLIRFWFIESQNLSVPSVTIEKPYENLGIKSDFKERITSRARADLYDEQSDTVIEFKYHKKIKSSDSCKTTNMGEVFRDLNRLSVLNNKEKYLIYVFDSEMMDYYNKYEIANIFKIAEKLDLNIPSDIKASKNSHKEFYKTAFSSFDDNCKDFSEFTYTVKTEYSNKITTVMEKDNKPNTFYIKVYKVT